jgi:hypothetical protein
MTEKRFYSVRSGRNPNCVGFEFPDFLELFFRLYCQMVKDGYFDEYLGSYCVDAGEVPGKVADVEYDVLVKLRKQSIWPIWNSHDSIDTQQVPTDAFSKATGLT